MTRFLSACGFAVVLLLLCSGYVLDGANGVRGEQSRALDVHGPWAQDTAVLPLTRGEIPFVVLPPRHVFEVDPSLRDLAVSTGSFDAVLTGDAEAALAGDALFVTMQAEEVTMQAIVLYVCGDDERCNVIQFTRLTGEAPAAGTYSLSEDDDEGDFSAIYYIVAEGELVRLCGGDSGELEITGTGSQVDGTFSFSAIDILEAQRDREDPFTVQVEGSFAAPEGDERQLPEALQKFGQ